MVSLPFYKSDVHTPYSLEMNFYSMHLWMNVFIDSNFYLSNDTLILSYSTYQSRKFSMLLLLLVLNFMFVLLERMVNRVYTENFIYLCVLDLYLLLKENDDNKTSIL